MRKILAILLAALMMCSVCLTFASAEATTTIELCLPINSAPEEFNEDGKPNMWYAIVKLFEEKYPQYKVEYMLAGANSDDSNAFWQMQAAADNLSDLTFGSFGYVKTWSEAGLLLDLSKYVYDEFLARFSSGAVDYTNQFNAVEGIYGLPCRAETQGWLYNTDLFAQVGLEIPTTWTEFMNAVKVFRENGITPIAHGGIDIWAIWGYHAMFNNYGLDWDMAQQLQNRELMFKDCDAFVKTFTRIAELAAAGAYDADVATINNQVALERFAAGQAAMYCIFDGIATGTFEGYLKSGESDISNHCVFNFGPKFEDGVEDFCGLRTYGWTLIPSVKVEKDEAKLDAVLKFLDVFFSEEGTEIVRWDMMPATVFEGEETEEKSMLMESMLASYVADIVPVPDNNQAYFDQSIKPTYRNAITGLICGTMTVDEALQMMQDWADTM